MEPDLVIGIDLDSTVPAYRQIIDALRALMVEGRLRPGDRLPTVRRLAVDLAVHHNTVAEAYRQLADEGWVDLRRRRGAVVTHRQGPQPTPDAEHLFARRLRELIAKAQAEGLRPNVIAAVLDGFADRAKEVES